MGTLFQVSNAQQQSMMHTAHVQEAPRVIQYRGRLKAFTCISISMCITAFVGLTLAPKCFSSTPSLERQCDVNLGNSQFLIVEPVQIEE